jgi:hypothetical protein
MDVDGIGSTISSPSSQAKVRHFVRHTGRKLLGRGIRHRMTPVARYIHRN